MIQKVKFSGKIKTISSNADRTRVVIEAKELDSYYALEEMFTHVVDISIAVNQSSLTEFEERSGKGAVE